MSAAIISIDPIMHDATSLSRPRTPDPIMAANRWDRAGVVISGLCAIHCLALPVLLLGLPITHAHDLHAAIHPVIAMLATPVALRSLRQATAGGGLLRIGLLFVVLGLASHNVLGDGVALVLTLAGSALLIAGHRCNLRCHHGPAL